MKIHFDRELCQGHNRCYLLAPELFESDDVGDPILIKAIPEGEEETTAARLAVEACPEDAITMEDDDA